MLKFWVLTPENAIKYYETSLEKEAVTEDEKRKILDDMEASGDVITSGISDVSKDDFVKKLSEYMNVLEIKKRKK